MTVLAGSHAPGVATAACRLFAAADPESPGAPVGLEQHVARFGEIPLDDYPGTPGRRILIETVARSGLRGRGGAGFPLADKLAAVTGKETVVVGNGCEGDPTSGKDRTLLRRAPHLVLDGIALAAHAVGAKEALLAVHEGSPLAASLADASAERDDPVAIEVVEAPAKFVASERTALAAELSGAPAKPTGTPTARRGVRGRPTLVSNVETLAHLALIARFGADWFRALGTPDSPGSLLVTVTGAVARSGVHEVAHGVPVSDALELAGGETGPLSAVLLGGLGGTWMPIAHAAELPLAHETFAETGDALGVASIVALPAGACGLAEAASVLRYLARESAGQCGPCLFGLPAVAEDLSQLAAGEGGGSLLPRLRKRLDVIEGRGACGHPDGAVRMAASALDAFAGDVTRHVRGQPCAGSRQRRRWVALPS